MFNRLIAWSLHNRLLVIAATLAFFAATAAYLRACARL